MGTRRFWLILAALVLASSVAMGIQQHMIAYLTDMGYGQQYASGIYSLSMGVLMAGKVILGTLYDRLGIKGASVYICLALAASLGFLLMADLPGIPYLFAAAFGLANAIQSIPATCLVTRFLVHGNLRPYTGYAMQEIWQELRWAHPCLHGYTMLPVPMSRPGISICC